MQTRFAATARHSPACEAWRGVVRSFPFTIMDVCLEPQGKRVSLAGRRRVGDIVRGLGIVSGTVLVIRGDELLTDDQFVEDHESIEVRAVISGGMR